MRPAGPAPGARSLLSRYAAFRTGCTRQSRRPFWPGGSIITSSSQKRRTKSALLGRKVKCAESAILQRNNAGNSDVRRVHDIRRRMRLDLANGQPPFDIASGRMPSANLTLVDPDGAEF